jgi:aspartate/methionine/tyrosine aminotransferase
MNYIKLKVQSSNSKSFLLYRWTSIENADDFARWLLESYDLDGETVMVAPAAGFYSTPGVGLNQVRIAYVLKKKN